MSAIDLNTFPTSKISALTMLHLEQLGCRSLTPEELLDKYEEVYTRIKKHDQELKAIRIKKQI